MTQNAYIVAVRDRFGRRVYVRNAAMRRLQWTSLRRIAMPLSYEQAFAIAARRKRSEVINADSE